MTDLATQTLHTAIGELGVKEEPPGSNSGPRIQIYQDWISPEFEHQSWCVCFCLWCIAHAAHGLGVETVLPKVASSSALYHWYVEHGKLLAHPEPGCIGMLKGGPTGHEHTFLVESVDNTAQGGFVHSIDGNWGNRVMRTTHLIEQCDFGVIC